MTYEDLKELSSAIFSYRIRLKLFRKLSEFDKQKYDAVKRLHEAIEKINVDNVDRNSIKECFKGFDIYKTSIVCDTKGIFQSVEALQRFVLDDVPYCKRYDPNIRTVIDFCKKFGATWEIVEDYFESNIIEIEDSSKTRKDELDSFLEQLSRYDHFLRCEIECGGFVDEILDIEGSLLELIKQYGISMIIKKGENYDFSTVSRILQNFYNFMVENDEFINSVSTKSVWIFKFICKSLDLIGYAFAKSKK